MSSIRFFIALWACKAAQIGLRLLHRGGTTFPGKLAFKLCPNVLLKASKGVDTLIITGTNGKTTTSRMVEQIVVEQGTPYIANRSGANLMSGVVTEFIKNLTIFGKKRVNFAVIECDEAAFAQVTKFLKPKAIAVTNLFRDQLDRYGEVTNTLEFIRRGIKNSVGADVHLNGDCPLTASLAKDVSGKTFFFGLNTPKAFDEGTPSDVPRCLHCGGKYEYKFHTFAHLGSWYCNSCGEKRPELNTFVETTIEALPDSTVSEFSSNGQSFTMEVPLAGDYNLYNACTALSLVSSVNIPLETAISGIEKAKCGFGRMEKFEINNKAIRMILVKNPTGCDRAIDYISSAQESDVFVMCLNDKYADGTDISWIWDSAFEKLSKFNTSRFVVSGTRMEDMALRLKYAGLSEGQITKIPSEEDLIDFIAKSNDNIYIMPTYTAMLSMRDKLGSMCGKDEFWR